ncbi:MAG: hypothetical protein B7Z37_15305 [Verrucomicrobia bacterium 12-59-8]|nr:MAG: hypothetical protein B7Z37_15305 [Verrucomicrobia bacterium 12-59-8]
MITKPDIAALWLEACPSFGPAFMECCADDGGDLPYIQAGAFARHLLSLHLSDQRAEFPAIAEFIERLHTDCDPYTREFATIGILESIQNIWGHSNVSADAFLPFLLPVSASAWHGLNQFWAGEVPRSRGGLPGGTSIDDPHQVDPLRGILRGMDTTLEREADRL